MGDKTSLKGLGWVVALALLIAGCQQNPHDTVASEGLQLTADYRERCQLLDALPAPTETAMRLHRQDPLFRADLLLPAGHTDYLRTTERQALGLGAYVADVAYANLYQHPLEAGQSLRAVETLAQKLNLSDALNVQALAKGLEEGVSSDTLMSRLNLGAAALSTQLQKRGQLPLAAMAVAGCYLEGLYLLARHAKATQKPALLAELANQKSALDVLLAAWPDTAGSDNPATGKTYALLRATQRSLEDVQEVALSASGEWRQMNDLAVYMDQTQPLRYLPTDKLPKLLSLLAQARQQLQAPLPDQNQLSH